VLDVVKLASPWEGDSSASGLWRECDTGLRVEPCGPAVLARGGVARITLPPRARRARPWSGG